MDTDTVSMEEVLAKPITWDATQRCDRCGAQAHAQVFFTSGLDLLFCNHHKAEYEKKLEQVALTIRSDSDTLD